MDYENHNGKKDSMPKGRRNFLKSTAVAGTTIFAFPKVSESVQGKTTPVETNSSAESLETRYNEHLGRYVVTPARNLNLTSPDDYDPYMTSRLTAGLDADGDDADITITRGLSLVGISEDLRRDYMYYKFRYQAMGLCVDTSYGKMRGKEPFLSDHFIRMHSRESCDLSGMYTDGLYLKTKSSIPEGASLNGWSTGEDDLYSADPGAGDNINEILGVSSIILGLAAAYPPLSIGATAALTGSSTAIGIGSLMSGFDVETDHTKNEDYYGFSMEESGWNGTNDLAIWVHDFGFEVGVPKGQRPTITFKSGVKGSKIVGGSNTEMSWVDEWGDQGGFDISFRAVDSADEALNNLPEIFCFNFDYDQIIDSHQNTRDPVDPSGPDKCSGDYCVNSAEEEPSN